MLDFMNCRCGVSLQSGYLVVGHHSVHTEGFDGFDCIACGRGYNEKGKILSSKDKTIRFYKLEEGIDLS